MKAIEKSSSSKQGRKTRRISKDLAPLSITSLLDALTIILVFLIKNVSMEVQKFSVPDKMVFPATMSLEKLQDNMGTTIIRVYPDRILVGIDNILFGSPQELLQDPQKRSDLYEYLKIQTEQIEKDAEKNQACLLVQADEIITTAVITAIVDIGTNSYYKYIYFSTLLDSEWLINTPVAQN